jgi:hypothetical protein
MISNNDVRYAIQVILDDIAAEPPERRVELLDAIIEETTDRATRMRDSALYDLRRAGVSPSQLGITLGVTAKTVRERVNAHRERTGVPPVMERPDPERAIRLPTR